MATSHHGGHSDQPDPKIIERLMQQLDGTARREYPRGRMGHQDDGALSYAVTADHGHGTVVIRFGKPVEWIGLHPDDVAKLVEALVKRAKEVAKEPFTVSL